MRSRTSRSRSSHDEIARVTEAIRARRKAAGELKAGRSWTRFVILAWSQFVFAEGRDDEIRIAFASHDIVVKGSGLSTLLQAITAQEARTIRQAAQHEAFPAPTAAARFIREIEIRRVDAE